MSLYETIATGFCEAEVVMFSNLDLKSLWKELDEYDYEVEEESKTLQEVWIKIAELKEVNQHDASLYVSKDSNVSLTGGLDPLFCLTGLIFLSLQIG